MIRGARIDLFIIDDLDPSRLGPGDEVGCICEEVGVEFGTKDTRIFAQPLRLAPFYAYWDQF